MEFVCHDADSYIEQKNLVIRKMMSMPMTGWGRKTHARQQGETVRCGLQPRRNDRKARRDTLLL